MSSTLVFGQWTIILGLIGLLIIPLLCCFCLLKVNRISRVGGGLTRKDAELMFMIVSALDSPRVLLIPTIQFVIGGLIFGIAVDSIITYFT